VAKSTEFSYQELAKATNNFSLYDKIGKGGLELSTMQNLEARYETTNIFFDCV